MKLGIVINKRIFRTLLLASVSSIFLYLVGVLFYNDTTFWFLNWNLFLAWLPLLFACLLVDHLKTKRWLSPVAILYSLLWLGFLPNSFYIASDLVHLRLATNSTALYYVVLILSFSLNGFVLGFISLYLIHKQLLKRVSERSSHLVIGLILLLSSFAIYVGRYLRWNTWDVLVNPAGLLFDVSDRLINPAIHEQTFRITILLFILLGSIYLIVWQLIGAIRKSKD